tara:strand:+ start:1024 stop:2466 length:1443 start_codon:yes stop_codon:yes gene_type:complete
MADQGLLAQSKPGANTNTLLYSAPVDKSASTVLTVANDGTGSAYKVGIKDYDQKLTLDASTYRLHKGDLVTGYKVTVNNAMDSTSGFTGGSLITSDDSEKTFYFESFAVPDVTTWYVKTASIRQVTLESVTGTFVVGGTLSTGTSPDDTTAVIYGVVGTILYIGPSTINGSGAEFADGNSVSSGAASGTISSGGIGTASNDFIISTTTAGGTYSLFLGDPLEAFTDRTYKFDLSDSSMTGRDFKISSTVNGIWGADGVIGGGDDGVEYTTGKTSGGTAGSSGAFIQYDWTASTALTVMYFYDGGSGTASNADYGGADRSITMSSQFTYTDFFVYDVSGTWTNGSDSFTQAATTFTVTAQTVAAYGYVRDYTGTTLKVIKGLNSPDFAGSDTFKDAPLLENLTRNTVTVNSVDVATTALEDENYIVNGVTNGNNEVDRITSLVVGPGEKLIINSTTANNSFSLIGFEDASTAFTARVFATI